MSDLATALREGDAASVAAAIAADPDAVSRPLGDPPWPPLVHVAHSPLLGTDGHTDGLVRTAEVLLDAGADPDASWRHPEFGDLSALYGAAGVAHEPRMTALLLARGATPDDDESVYHATETRDHTCLQLLLDAGAKVVGTNALAHVMDFDDVDGLRLLLERAAEQEGEGFLGSSSSHDTPGLIRFALTHDRSRAHVELLLRHGARPAPGDAELAVRRGRTDLGDLLGDASPSPADELLGAARAGDRGAAEAVMKRHPGLLSELGRGDLDALVHTAALGNRTGTEILLDLGFPIDIRSEDFDETPLHAAAYYGRIELVRLLLDRGADPRADAGKPFGGSPLEWAERGRDEADHDVFGHRRGVDHDETVRVLAQAAPGSTIPDS